MQAIQTKNIGPTAAYPEGRVRATAPRGTMLVEVPNDMMVGSEQAHIYAAGQLAAKFAKEDAKRGDLSGVAYWSSPRKVGGIGGNMYAHLPVEVEEVRVLVYLYAITGNIPSTGFMILDAKGRLLDFVPGARLDLRRKYRDILNGATYQELPTTRRHIKYLIDWATDTSTK